MRDCGLRCSPSTAPGNLYVCVCVCSILIIPIYAIAEDQYIEREIFSLFRMFDVPENRRSDALQLLMLLRLLAGQTNL